MLLFTKSNAMNILKNKMTQFANILIRMEWPRKKNLFYFTAYLRVAIAASYIIQRLHISNSFILRYESFQTN